MDNSEKNNNNNNNRIKVLLTTEGTYPYSGGGVSTWCHSLVQNLDELVDFKVYSIVMNPYVNLRYDIPEEKIIQVPLWGTDEPFEHLNIPFSKVFRSRSITTNEVIKDEFLPLFKEVVAELVNDEKKPLQFGHLLLEMYNYFKKYDYKETFKSKIVWDAFNEYVLDMASAPGYKLPQPTVFSMIQSLGWLYRFFTILTTPVPKVDICHSAAAAFSGIPCVLAKLMYNTPYLLTEHGVFLREQYLSLGKRDYDPYLNVFFIRMIKSIVRLNYAYADQVSPVCDYNTRWERKLGVMPRKIEVIHNGVCKNYFDPGKYEEPASKRGGSYKVISVARIDPVKDIVSFIRAAEIVKEKFEDVTFHVYGGVTVPEYCDECNIFLKNSKVSDCFFLEGNSDNIPKEYASADVVVLSSITEAFPYSVVEAMMMGKAIVATDVGGITEALEGVGTLVTAGKPEELAQGILELLQNEELRNRYETAAKERAIELFDIDMCMDKYYCCYKSLVSRTSEMNSEIERFDRQRLLAEKGYALIGIGEAEAGTKYLKQAIKEVPDSQIAVDLANVIGEVYGKDKDLPNCEDEIARAEYIKKLLKDISVA